MILCLGQRIFHYNLAFKFSGKTTDFLSLYGRVQCFTKDMNGKEIVDGFYEKNI